MSFVRTPTGVIIPKGDPYWGVTLVESENPDATPIPEGMLDAIQLPDDLPKLTPRQTGAILGFFDHILTFDNAGELKADGSTMEAVAVLLRGNGVHNPRTIYRVLVPTSFVGGGYTKQDYESGELVDIETGESFPNLPAAVFGWVHAGDIHSHGRLPAYHSSVDDASDLKQPGLHIVVGGIPDGGTTLDSFDTEQSIVRDGRRYFDVFEGGKVRKLTMWDFAEPSDSREFHPEVLRVVTQGPPPRSWESTCGEYSSDIPLWEWMDEGEDLTSQMDMLRSSYPELSDLLWSLEWTGGSVDEINLVLDELRKPDVLASLRTSAHEIELH